MNAGSASASGTGIKAACRAIEASDVPALVNLLANGFPERDRSYWSDGLNRLGRRPLIGTFPRYGYLLSVDGAVVGCLLAIVSHDDQGQPRANVSSWYVLPAYRSLASMLVSVMFRHKQLTFVNVSPAPHTVPILEAQGYKRFTAGQVVAVPGLSRAGVGARVDEIVPETLVPHALQSGEAALLARHASYGCLAFVCVSQGISEPFVFARCRVLRGVVPAAQLVWCRDISRVPRFAGAIGRALLRHGLAAITVDANGPIAGLPGLYRPGRAPRYYRGAHQPRLGDLADTEIAVFGA